jgi:hypothetical protein
VRRCAVVVVGFEVVGATVVLKRRDGGRRGGAVTD